MLGNDDSTAALQGLWLEIPTKPIASIAQLSGCFSPPSDLHSRSVETWRSQLQHIKEMPAHRGDISSNRLGFYCVQLQVCSEVAIDDEEPP